MTQPPNSVIVEAGNRTMETQMVIGTPVMVPTSSGSGGIGFVRVKEDEFEQIMRKVEKPLVIVQGKRTKIYATKYNGFVFYTKTKSDLSLPSGSETIRADHIHITH